MTRRAAPDAMPAESEASFQDRVVKTAHSLGWRTFAVRKSAAGSAKTGKLISMVTKKGWVDLVLWKNNEIIFWELKSDKGKLSPEQAEVLESLAPLEFIHRVGCVRPRDWEEIEGILRGER